MDHPVFEHEGPWTEEAYLALGSEDGRVEVVDGTLLVGPGLNERRAMVVTRLREAVEAALPAGLRIVDSVPLRLGLDCILVPDFVVTNSARPERDANGAARRLLDASEALMVIEVVGHDHGIVDREFKPQLYARCRIPYSLLIDHDGPFAVADMIIGGRYHEYASARGGEILRLEEPFELQIDLAGVTAQDGRSQAAATAAG